MVDPLAAGTIADQSAGQPPQELLHSVADYKSARYSVLAPLQLGLLAGGAHPQHFEAELRRYARLVGIVGQLRDDYLDLFGDASVLGKPTGSDLRAGRRSYAVSAILAAAGGAERAVVESALGDGTCTEQTVSAVREIGHRHGVDRRLRADLRRYAEQAAAEAAGWRPRWRAEAVAFFECLPLAGPASMV